jgi:hypothetical protein
MRLADEIDAIIADAIKRRIFPGAVVMIAQGAEVLHYAAYGTTMYADPGSQVVQLDTIYDVASLTKMFTATAVLRLSDAGKLDLGLPVAIYLPEFRAPDVLIPPVRVRTVPPDYPSVARAALIEGDVLLQAVVGPDGVVASVEGEPTALEVHLEPGAEVHRRGVTRHADVAKITGAVTRWNIHAAAKSDG